MKAIRGAVLVESAFAVALILMFVYGAIQLAAVGFEQLTVDGGAFAAAHQKSLLGANLKGYADATLVAKAALPHMNSSNIQVPEPVVVQPPTTDTTNFTTQYNLNNANARHGGVSMIQPAQAISTVKSNNLPGLLLSAANDLAVTGIAIDPAFRLINGHGDVSGNDFNGAGAFATAADPLVDGNNAPPYFIGFNYMLQCPYSYAQNHAPGWTTCPKPLMVSLGLAEYLDVNNWGRAVNGVVPSGTAVFYEARLHQNMYANIAKALAGVTNPLLKGEVLDPVSSTNANDIYVQCVYSFDNANLGMYELGTTKIGDFPVTPAGNPALCGS